MLTSTAYDCWCLHCTMFVQRLWCSRSASSRCSSGGSVISGQSLQPFDWRSSRTLGSGVYYDAHQETGAGPQWHSVVFADIEFGCRVSCCSWPSTNHIRDATPSVSGIDFDLQRRVGSSAFVGHCYPPCCRHWSCRLCNGDSTIAAWLWWASQRIYCNTCSLCRMLRSKVNRWL